MKKKKFSIPDSQVTALGLALQQRRLEVGLSQEDLAEKAGLHRTYVSLIERKSCNFSIKIYMRLAYALEIEPAELMQMAEGLVTTKKR
ncbi:MAG: helix-turn-helix transcriptional regulator [Candidatus Obscuribacterales bacterium]|jgi:transcriptional regulator with XRE-family HTH domain|nr:helix-turn-helix transcriptional regulator [Candidatus Obscuribacterales bacterium]